MFHKIPVTFGLLQPSFGLSYFKSVVHSCYCLFVRVRGYGFLPEHFDPKHNRLVGAVDIPALR